MKLVACRNYPLSEADSTDWVLGHYKSIQSEVIYVVHFNDSNETSFVWENCMRIPIGSNLWELWTPERTQKHLFNNRASDHCVNNNLDDYVLDTTDIKYFWHAWFFIRSCTPSLQNCDWQITACGSNPFYNVSVKHSHIHSFSYCLWLLSRYKNTVK